jgi:hypothetical protein
MIRIPLLAVLGAAALSACASASGRGVDANDPGLPEHLGRIPIYWIGTKPQCQSVPVRAVAATSRTGLRQRAYESGADAVVEGRVSTRAVDRRPSIGNRSALPGLLSVYEGMAVRLSPKCLA